MPRSVVVTAALFCLLALSSCNFFDQKGKLTSISVSPTSPFVVTSNTQQFTATGVNDDGSSSTISGVTWSASTPTGTATVSINASTGLATAGGAGSGILGTSTITATSGSISGSTTMTVTSTALTSIGVTPNPATVSVSGVGANKTLQFQALFNGGGGADITNSVQWSSSNTSVATISSAGLATAVASSGTPITITATAGGVSGTAQLTVNP